MEINTVFFRACEEGNMQIVKKLIPKLKEIDVKTEQGWTGLVLAVYNENFEVAQLLVGHGANVNETNYKGTTVFMYAKTPVLRSKNTKMLSWLLDNGAAINSVDLKASLTVLDYVKAKEVIWLVEWLRKRGAKYSHEL